MDKATEVTEHHVIAYVYMSMNYDFLVTVHLPSDPGLHSEPEIPHPITVVKIRYFHVACVKVGDGQDIFYLESYLEIRTKIIVYFIIQSLRFSEFVENCYLAC
jgi:hypothetical protein